MAINERLVHTASAAAAAGTGNQEEGLILHLDANDVDSYDGDGDVWYDIHDHEYAPTTNVSEHFNTVLYPGNDGINEITGVGFQPDLVWIKRRNSSTYNHVIRDSVRGTDSVLSSDTNNAESVVSNRFEFITDGFKHLVGTQGANNSAGTYVAWCFKAGGPTDSTNIISIDDTQYTNYSDAGLTQHSSAPSQELSINTKLGISIVKANSVSVNHNNKKLTHGLGQEPEMSIYKFTNTSSSWYVYHKDLGKDRYLVLNATDAQSSVYANRFFVDANHQNALLDSTPRNFVIYNFISKRGVSKVGSYIGNGSANNKIYTGFEPAFVMFKNTSLSNTRWIIMDNARDPNNPAYKVLSPNSNAAEDASSSYWLLDWERDGFRLKYGADNEFNRNGDTFIYYAVAKSTNETDLIDDTDLELHLDAGDFPQKGETNYSNTPTTWEDKTSNNYDGTISGAVFDSELGNWLDFDGSNDYVSISSTSTTPVDFSAKNYTIEAWINADTFTNGKPILTKYGTTDANRSIYFSIQSDGTLRLLERSSSSAIHVSTSSISINKWHHVCVSRSSSTVKFYIDGNLDNTISSSFTPNTGGNESINIGSQANGNYNFFSGEIGQVRVYNAALSEEAIRKNLNFTKNDYPNGYNATRIGATFSPSTTPNYWSFDGNNDSMLLSTTSNLLGDTNNIKTISGFVTLSSATARGFIYSVSASNNSNDYFYIGWLGDNNKVYVASRDGSSSNSFTHTAPLTGVADTWKHICVTGGDGNAPKIYVNGVELTVTSSTSGSATNASWIDYPSYSGTVYTNIAKLRQASPGSTHWHNGRIGQVKLYDKTLSSTEVLALFNAEKDIYGL